MCVCSINPVHQSRRRRCRTVRPHSARRERRSGRSAACPADLQSDGECEQTTAALSRTQPQPSCRLPLRVCAAPVIEGHRSAVADDGSFCPRSLPIGLHCARACRTRASASVPSSCPRSSNHSASPFAMTSRCGGGIRARVADADWLMPFLAHSTDCLTLVFLFVSARLSFSGDSPSRVHHASGEYGGTGPWLHPEQRPSSGGGDAIGEGA